MLRTVLVQAASLATLPFVRAAVAQTGEVPGRDNLYRYGPGMMWGSDSLGGFGMILGPILMVLVLGVLAVGILYFLRALGVVSLGRNAGVGSVRGGGGNSGFDRAVGLRWPSDLAARVELRSSHP